MCLVHNISTSLSMTVRLRLSPDASPAPPFSWDNVPTSPPPPSDTSTPGTPPTQWLSATDMKVFGAEPLKSPYALIKCGACGKPVLESAIGEHAGKRACIRVGGRQHFSLFLSLDNCAKIRSGGKKGAKGKAGADDGGRSCTT